MDNLEIIRVKKTTEANKERNKKYLRVGTKWKLNSPDAPVRVEIVAIKNDMVSVAPEFNGVKAEPMTIPVDDFLDLHKPTKRTIKQADASVRSDNDCKEPNVKVSFHIMLGMLRKCPDLVAHRATHNPDETVYIETVDGKQELWVVTGDPNSSVTSRKYTPIQADMIADDWIVTRGV